MLHPCSKITSAIDTDSGIPKISVTDDALGIVKRYNLIQIQVEIKISRCLIGI